MTLDERIEFLFKPAESLHASTQELHAELHARNQEMYVSIRELRELAQEHTKQLQIDAENIRRLANIAGARKQRITGLEGSPE